MATATVGCHPDRAHTNHVRRKTTAVPAPLTSCSSMTELSGHLDPSEPHMGVCALTACLPAQGRLKDATLTLSRPLDYMSAFWHLIRNSEFSETHNYGINLWDQTENFAFKVWEPGRNFGLILESILFETFWMQRCTSSWDFCKNVGVF